MRRIPWDIVLALVVGIGLGLVYAWLISPMKVTNASPTTLRGDFKEQYRSAIAAAYAATGNLPRARSRLELLKDPNSEDALNTQAQQMLAKGQSGQAADQVAALAQALQKGSEESTSTANPVTEAVISVQETDTPTVIPASTEELTLVVTETQSTTEPTQPPEATLVPRPTKTPIPTQGTPFKLISQDEVCDPNLPDGLLQVIVLSSNRRQMPGMEIDITWDGGENQFFTGLKPEIGNGYADFVMTPDVSYTVQLAAGSEIATGLTSPTCQTPNGENFNGGMKLTFQQP